MNKNNTYNVTLLNTSQSPKNNNNNIENISEIYHKRYLQTILLCLSQVISTFPFSTFFLILALSTIVYFDKPNLKANAYTI